MNNFVCINFQKAQITNIMILKPTKFFIQPHSVFLEINIVIISNENEKKTFSEMKQNRADYIYCYDQFFIISKRLNMIYSYKI